MYSFSAVGITCCQICEEWTKEDPGGSETWSPKIIWESNWGWRALRAHGWGAEEEKQRGNYEDNSEISEGTEADRAGWSSWEQ